MTPGRAPRPALLAAAVLLGLAGACSGGDGGGSGTTTTTTAAPTTTTPPGPPAGAVEAGLRSVTPGQCFVLADDDPAAEDRAVWALDCARPHTHEVYDVVEYGGPVLRGGAYPGEAPVQDWSEQACFDRFEGFVGVPWTRSELEIQVWWPSPDSWGRGDRSVVCAVFPATGDTVQGTRRDSRR